MCYGVVVVLRNQAHVQLVRHPRNDSRSLKFLWQRRLEKRCLDKNGERVSLYAANAVSRNTWQ